LGKHSARWLSAENQ